ncbi:MAG TPA: hypothetical protein VLX89_00525 [Actinomycetota bacterium]|nr:hypothetical protein [Actinomycetota bacterium]
MKRVAIVGAVLLMLLPGCATRERPEGVVERWLLSLNQGAAGRPDRFASSALSEQVVPGWQHIDPGHLDTIEVGAPAPDPGVAGGSLVPFRIVDVDGAQVEGVASVGGVASGRRVTAITLGRTPPGLPLPSEGGPTPGRISATAWLAALGVAAVLSLLAVGVVVLVRRTAARAPDVT